MMRILVLMAMFIPGLAQAAELKVLSAGAYRGVLVAMAPELERETGHKLVISNETAGGVAARVKAGEVLDLVVLPPSNAAGLAGLIGPVVALAKVGIGVAAKEGAARPDISTVAGVRAAVLGARAPAWIDPAAGGSSGIYIAGLWAKWGIAGEVAGKAVLVHGGLVADKIRSGEADLAFQQLSELTGAPGVVVLGPLPAEIQNFTTYSGAVPASSVQKAAAGEVLAWLAGPHAAEALRARGMETP